MTYIPIATYRIQFCPDFGFPQCRVILDYLKLLGISDIYASPISLARPGSTHGYDVCDHGTINPELGGESEFLALTEARRELGMGWIQDIVPNHMAMSGHNPALVDVLENGQASRMCHFFDIDWNHPQEALKGRLLAPFLGAFFGEILENGELSLGYDEYGFFIQYHDFRWPINLESYARILTKNLHTLKSAIGRDHPDYIKLLGLLYTIRTMGGTEDPDPEELYHQISFVKRILWELYESNSEFRDFLHANLDLFNGKGLPTKRDSFNLLDEILTDQFYRLSFWKVAADEINYRRFFSINDLICMQVEEPDVFQHIHASALSKIRDGSFTGLRIDHIDGLFDPMAYLRRLRLQAPNAYIVVEKILGIYEDLPSQWSIQGTTGYDFLNYVNMVFCNPDGEQSFQRIYRSFSGMSASYTNLVREKRRLIIEEDMAGDVQNLARLIQHISIQDRYARDITFYRLHRALMEVLALFPVYRTYISFDSFEESDRLYIQQAVEAALRSTPALSNELNFIKRFLLLDFPEYLTEHEREQWVHFAMRFQQFTGPLMAKGFEDTFLYVFNRLVSLNEVGSEPYVFGFSLDQFHQHIMKRSHSWPHSMNATVTHDTKRGEDTRARINVLSEISDEWDEILNRWAHINREKKRMVNGSYVPDGNDEYFLYQTLVGAFPFDMADQNDFVHRLKEYVVKAVREAKIHTAWLQPDTEYESAFVTFVESILNPVSGALFLEEFIPFQRHIAHYGILNGLSQVLIKMTSPGIPDFYQGTELWDLSLVDPDNRRPVDFGKRLAMLTEIQDKANTDILGLIEELIETRKDGRIKLFLIKRVLDARKYYSELFTHGNYTPIVVTGRFSNHLVAFVRRHGKEAVIAVAPRFLTSVVSTTEVFPLGKDAWHDTRFKIALKDNAVLHNLITGQAIDGVEALDVGKTLEHFPVSLLYTEDLT
jgi:(1->4)-alpha-D-glucan 1-alpha-D-glucosylmutase